MKKLLLGLLLSMVVSTTMAASPFTGRQDTSDGRSVWTKLRGTETAPVGDSGLTVRVTNLSSAGTYYVISHRSGLLTKAYATLEAGLDADSNSPGLTFFLATAASANNSDFTQVSNTLGAVLSITATGTEGSVTSITFDNKTTMDVSSGGVIAIVSDGGSTGVSGATITLVIE